MKFNMSIVSTIRNPVLGAKANIILGKECFMFGGNYFNSLLFYAKEKPKSYSELGNF